MADQIVSLIENQHIHEQSKGIESNNNKNSTEAVKCYYSSATILFADIVGFTSKVERIEPGELLLTLDTFFQGFDKIVDKNKIQKVKTIGDAYMCVGGIIKKTKSHAKNVCKSALDML